MSYQGQTWVDAVALPRLQNSGELLVMLRVANHAGNGYLKMSGCTAGSKRLAAECLMGQSTVLNHLRNLVKRGLLVPGDPALVAHLPADKRPPVYDLAGGHEPGCIGGHTDLDNCEIGAGAQIEHPRRTPRKTRRSAGAENEHPSPSEGGAGAQIQTERVLKSSTKSSKELKVSLCGPAGAQQQADAALKDAEREPAPQTKTNPDAATVSNALAAQWRAAHGTAPGRRQMATVTQDAADALDAGDTLAWLLGAVVPFMVNRRYLDLGHAKTHPKCPTAKAGYSDEPEMCPQHPTFRAGQRCIPCRSA